MNKPANPSTIIAVGASAGGVAAFDGAIDLIAPIDLLAEEISTSADSDAGQPVAIARGA